FTENLGQRIAIAGLVIYVAFAPHSVAGSAIGVAVAGIGWVIRSVATRSLGLRRSRFDLVIVLSIVWTALSSVLSEEPDISVAKLTSVWTVFLFYLTRAVLTRRTAVLLVALLILSGCVGTAYSAFDLMRGRGVVVESIAPRSPFQQVGVLAGDTIWRVGAQRVYSVAELDEALKKAPVGVPLRVSVISQGEHVERPGLVMTAAQQQAMSPAGVTGSARNHRFRASGWTRHYETFSEVLQIVALLALGLALTHLRNHGANKHFRIALAAAAFLTLGLVFTAMRTVIVAFVLGACVIAWRSVRGSHKVVFTFALFFVLAFGAVVVWQTRARDALSLNDPSSQLRFEVARVGLSRIPLHPVFGHGMDAMKRHWNEWGFPGKDLLHLHSTPLQLAFDRGLPMLLLWLWMMILFWTHISTAVRRAADLSDTHVYGVLLGGLGALTGFLASSLVNYNYGDSEVVMLFWWLMGVCVFLSGLIRSEP
ncbi:MAG TPA: O-antigen ligase family protein, partial [Pyrinomonadaceae bacterium]|nr:O-antigen ligase family protein [Pyrinomonadaceae bacterium]